MVIERWAVALLRFFLVLLFVVLVFFQVFALPGEFAHSARVTPDEAYLRWPLTAVTVFWLLCAEVVIVSTWRLLTLVREDRIFSDRSMAWVDAIVWAIGAAWVVLVGVSAYFGFQADDPGMPLVFLLTTTGLTVVGLLVVVLRALLRKATALRSDMEAVI